MRVWVDRPIDTFPPKKESAANVLRRIVQVLESKIQAEASWELWK